MRRYLVKAKQLPNGMIVPDCCWLMRWAMHHVSRALFRTSSAGWVLALYGYWGHSHERNYGICGRHGIEG